YRLVFRKSGLSRFIAHQNTLDLFEKAFRRLRWPVRMSQGFNPKPLMRNTGALPLGLESRREMIILEFTRSLGDNLAEACLRLSECLPEGMDAVALEPTTSVRVPHIASVLYRLDSSYSGGYPALEKGLS